MSDEVAIFLKLVCEDERIARAATGKHLKLRKLEYELRIAYSTRH